MVNLNPNRTNSPELPPPDVEGWRRAIKKAIRMRRTSLNYFSQISGIPLGNLSRFVKGGKLDKKYKRILGIDHRDLLAQERDELLWRLQHREDWRGNDRDSRAVHNES